MSKSMLMGTCARIERSSTGTFLTLDIKSLKAIGAHALQSQLSMGAWELLIVKKFPGFQVVCIGDNIT